MLVGARVQGIGGAVVSAVALSLMMTLTEPAERAKAMGVFGFVVGRRVDRWLAVFHGRARLALIFLVNVPVGILVVASFVLIPSARSRRQRRSSTSRARSR